MKIILRKYFLIFFNTYDPWEDPDYWKQDYITLGQIVFGVLAFPFFLIGYIFYLIISFKVKLKPEDTRT
jgi:hypothetical protein